MVLSPEDGCIRRCTIADMPEWGPRLLGRLQEKWPTISDGCFLCGSVAALNSSSGGLRRYEAFYFLRGGMERGGDCRSSSTSRTRAASWLRRSSICPFAISKSRLNACPSAMARPASALAWAEFIVIAPARDWVVCTFA